MSLSFISKYQENLNSATGSKETAWEATLTFSGHSHGRHQVGIGFSGTCHPQGALLEAAALAGKRSLRLTAVLKLMRPA